MQVIRRSGRWAAWLALVGMPVYAIALVVWDLRSGTLGDSAVQDSIFVLLALGSFVRGIQDLTTPYARVTERDITFYDGWQSRVVPWERAREFSPWGNGKLWYLWLHGEVPVEVRFRDVISEDREGLRSAIERHLGSGSTA